MWFEQSSWNPGTILWQSPSSAYLTPCHVSLLIGFSFLPRATKWLDKVMMASDEGISFSRISLYNAFWILPLLSSRRMLLLYKCPYGITLLLSHDFQLDPITHQIHYSDLLPESFTPWLNFSNRISVLITKISHTVPTYPLLQLKPVSIDLWDVTRWTIWFYFRILCISMVQTSIKPKSRNEKSHR